MSAFMALIFVLAETKVISALEKKKNEGRLRELKGGVGGGHRSGPN